MEKIYILISIFICFGMPIIWYQWIKGNNKGYVGVLIGGVLSFYLTQIIIRIPLLQLVLPNLTWYQKLSKNTIFIGLFLGITAALFETIGRFFTLHFLLRKRLSYKSGIVHGIGHGGIEAILLVGINYIFYLIYTILLSHGVSEPLFWIIPRGETQELMKSILMDTKSYLFLIAGVERGLTIIIHVSLSLLMTVGIVKKQILKYFMIVLGIHSLLDFITVIMSLEGASILLIEGVLVGFTLISVLIIINTKGIINYEVDKEEAQKAVDEGY